MAGAEEGIPSFQDIADIFTSPADECLQYLLDYGVIKIPNNCEICQMGSYILCRNNQYRCNMRNCRHERSIFKSTFFEPPREGDDDSLIQEKISGFHNKAS